MIRTNINIFEEKAKLSKIQLAKYYLAFDAIESMYAEKKIDKKQREILKARAVSCCRYIDLREEFNNPKLDDRRKNQIKLEMMKFCRYQGETYEDVKDVTNEFDRRLKENIDRANRQAQTRTPQRKAA